MESSDEIAIGSTVKITLVTERAENVMLVPVDAIYYSGGKGYVYLYEDGKAKMASVEVGLYDSENAQILSGIKADDMVVSTWSSNLYEGADIRLKSDAEAADTAGDGQVQAVRPRQVTVRVQTARHRRAYRQLAAHRTETQHRKHSKEADVNGNYQICTEASGHCADGALMPDRVWYFFGV